MLQISASHSRNTVEKVCPWLIHKEQQVVRRVNLITEEQHLGEHRDHIIKLGPRVRNSLNGKLCLSLSKPNLNLLWPKSRKLQWDSVDYTRVGCCTRCSFFLSRHFEKEKKKTQNNCFQIYSKYELWKTQGVWNVSVRSTVMKFNRVKYSTRGHQFSGVLISMNK